LLAEHPEGMPPLGTEQSVASLGREALLAFRDQYCVARNCVLSVFGDIDPAQAADLVERFFGNMTPGAEALLEPPRPNPLEISQTVEEEIDKQQAILLVGYRGVDLYHPDAPALLLLDEAFSDLGSRMFVRIREQLGLA
jgi:zinc protease